MLRSRDVLLLIIGVLVAPTVVLSARRIKGAWIRLKRIRDIQWARQRRMHRNLTVRGRVCRVVSCRVEFVRFPEE